MTRVHHPSDRLLVDYATGDLALPPALVVAAHLDGCARCRANVSRIEEAEGRLLDSLPGAPLAPDALERVLDRLGDAGREAVRPAPSRLGDVPLPRSLAAAGFGPRRFLKPDFWIAPVRTGRRDGWRTYVLRAPAGARIPAHRHRGGEFVCVLMGAFHDGRTYAEGDFAENPAGQDHELSVTSDGPCASLIAAEGGARWRGLTQALAPVLGI